MSNSNISELVGEFYDLEKKIKNNNDAVKNMKKDYKKLKESILDYMVDNNVNEMDTPDGKLIKKINKSKLGINNDVIKDGLNKIKLENITINDSNISRIVDEINKSRKMSEKITLQKSKKQEKKSN